MTDAEFTKLLTKCVKAASKHFMLQSEVNEECQRRYGCSYSDLDCDELIDPLDIQGCEKLTTKEFSESMKKCGVKRIDKDDRS